LISSDDSVLGVLVSDAEGRALAYAAKDTSGVRVLTDLDEIKRIGVVETLGMRLASRPGQDTGEVEYVNYVYEKFQIAITELRKPAFVVGLKLRRASNAGDVVQKIQQRYR
jgi:hypothetical protein